jgi:hypothetical protein
MGDMRNAYKILVVILDGVNGRIILELSSNKLGGKLIGFVWLRTWSSGGLL